MANLNNIFWTLHNSFFHKLYFEATIGTFINVFNKDQLTQVILNEGSAGVRVVEKFLGILQFVVKESDVSFRKFIDSTLALCLDYIYPLVATRPTSDVKGPLFTGQFLSEHIVFIQYLNKHFMVSSRVHKKHNATFIFSFLKK